MVRPSLSILDPASAIFLAALMTSDVFFSGPFPLRRRRGTISDCFWYIASSFNMQEQLFVLETSFSVRSKNVSWTGNTSGKLHQIQSARWYTHVHTHKTLLHHAVLSGMRMCYSLLKSEVRLSLFSKNWTITLHHQTLVAPTWLLIRSSFQLIFPLCSV